MVINVDAQDSLLLNAFPTQPREYHEFYNSTQDPVFHATAPTTCMLFSFHPQLSRPPASIPAHALLVPARRVDEHGVVLAGGGAALALGGGAGGRRRGGLVLEELGADLAAALLPPLLLGLGLGVNLGEALAELGVGGDFVGGLEDGRAPVGGEGVGLRKSVREVKNSVSSDSED